MKKQKIMNLENYQKKPQYLETNMRLKRNISEIRRTKNQKY